MTSYLAAATATRARWFALDRFGDAPPRIVTWVVRTDDIDAALARLPPGRGPAIEVTRGARR